MLPRIVQLFYFLLVILHLFRYPSSPSCACSRAFSLLFFSQIECHSKTAEELNDVYVMNLSLCSNVQVIKECNGNFIDDPQKLNLEQVCRRTSIHPFICFIKRCLPFAG